MKEYLYKMWTICNAKEISKETFEEKAGMSFHDFQKRYKKSCSLAWQVFVEKRREELRNKTGKVKSECICDEEEEKEPNAYRVVGETPMRLWKCPKHGNTFVDLTPHFIH